MRRGEFMFNEAGVREVNDYLADLKNPLMSELKRVVDKYGTPEEINAKAKAAGNCGVLMERLQSMGSPYYQDLQWLIKERDKGSFIPISQYRRNVFGAAADQTYFNDAKAVTLEISACQYFPWLIQEAKQAIEDQSIMPGRYIRVRKMRESENDMGDLMAMHAAMDILGASLVETLDSKGTDGSNVHLGGPDTITGYFGGIGMPNDHVQMWIDELLYYYTTYGVNQVLNISPGTVLAAYMLYKMGIDISFKISVFMGNDNPYSVLWTLMMAKMFAREDGSTPLAGFNISNSMDDNSILLSSMVRESLGLEKFVRIEHHITECYTSIVQQPYLRRDQLLDVVGDVPNISAKHEGGDPNDEMDSNHPSSILHYFRDKEEVIASGDMDNLFMNYMQKHNAVNYTARALTEKGYGFISAQKLHRR